MEARWTLTLTVLGMGGCLSARDGRGATIAHHVLRLGSDSCSRGKHLWDDVSGHRIGSLVDKYPSAVGGYLRLQRCTHRTEGTYVGSGGLSWAKYGRGAASATTYWMADVTKYSGIHTPGKVPSLPLSSVTLPHQTCSLQGLMEGNTVAYPTLPSQSAPAPPPQGITGAGVEIWGQDAP